MELSGQRTPTRPLKVLAAVAMVAGGAAPRLTGPGRRPATRSGGSNAGARAWGAQTHARPDPVDLHEDRISAPHGLRRAIEAARGLAVGLPWTPPRAARVPARRRSRGQLSGPVIGGSSTSRVLKLLLI